MISAFNRKSSTVGTLIKAVVPRYRAAGSALCDYARARRGQVASTTRGLALAELGKTSQIGNLPIGDSNKSMPKAGSSAARPVAGRRFDEADTGMPSKKPAS